MFTRIFKSTVVVSVVAFLAVAKGVPTSTTTSSSQCNNGGNVQCCNQMLNSTDAQDQGLGGLLDLLDIGHLLGDIGLNCVPINVLGIGNGANCVQQAACCDDMMQSGLINFGCSPINLDL